MALNKDKIFAAADNLAATGQTPTLANVRKELGGGSFTTISEAMTEWKARHQPATTPLQEAAPQTIADRLSEFGAEVWSIAIGLANARLAHEREALVTERSKMEDDKRQANEAADQISADLDSSQERCVELEERAFIAEKEVGDLRCKLTDALEKAHTAETRTVEIERRADDLKSALVAAQQQAEAERKCNRAEVEKLRAEMADYKQTIQSTFAELVAVKARAESAEQIIQELRKQAAAEAHRVAELMAKVEADRNDANRETSVAREEAAELRGKVEIMQTQTAELTLALATRQLSLVS